MKIFVIEPDAMLVRHYSEYLSEAGNEVYAFRSVALALKAINKVIPDVIVMEIALPGHNGLEFLYDLVSYDDTTRIRVVVCSFMRPDEMPWGYVSAEDLYVAEHLYKPTMKLEDLRDAVAHAGEKEKEITPS